MKQSTKVLTLIAVAVGVLAAAPVRAQSTLSDLVIINGQQFTFIEATNVSQFAPAFFPAPGLPNGAVLFFQDASQTVVSDQLYVQNGFWYFASDPDLQNLNAALVPVIGAIVENGQLQDVSGLFHLPPGAVLVQSDFEVPEPGSLSLALLGGGLLVAVKRRFQSQRR